MTNIIQSFNPKRTYRQYHPSELQENLIISVEEKTYHHLKNVLRLTKNSLIKIFNEQNGEFLAEVHDFSNKKQGLIEIKQKLREPNSCEIGPCLIFAPVKNHTTQIIEKATELGCSNIIPIECKHSVIRKFDIEKHQIIAISSSCQSERMSIPKIHPMIKLSEINSYEFLNNQKILFADENGTGKNFHEISKNSFHSCLIGPEGGFSKSELEFMRSHPKFESIHLGSRILKSETAAISCLTLMQFVNQNLKTKPVSKI